jgi:hypothetical protein
MEKTSEITRERGKRFLDELKEKGPDLSMVGKTLVKLTNSNIEYDEPLSESRKLKKLKYEIMKEMNEYNVNTNINKNPRPNLYRKFISFINNLLVNKF